MDDNLKKVWQTLSEDYELPDYDTFKEDMKDEENLRSLWTNAKKNYDLPDYDQFKADMGFGDGGEEGDDIATYGTKTDQAIESMNRKLGHMPQDVADTSGTPQFNGQPNAGKEANPQMFQKPAVDPEPWKAEGLTKEQYEDIAWTRAVNRSTPLAVDEEGQVWSNAEVASGNREQKTERTYQTKESWGDEYSRKASRYGELRYGWRRGQRFRQLDNDGNHLAGYVAQTDPEAAASAELMSDQQLIEVYNKLSKQINKGYTGGIWGYSKTPEGQQLGAQLNAIGKELHFRDLGYEHTSSVNGRGEVDYRSIMTEPDVAQEASRLAGTENRDAEVARLYQEGLTSGNMEAAERAMLASAALYCKERNIDIDKAYAMVEADAFNTAMRAPLQADVDKIYNEEKGKQLATKETVSEEMRKNRGIDAGPGGDNVDMLMAENIMGRREAPTREMLNTMAHRAIRESAASRAYYNLRLREYMRGGSMDIMHARAAAMNDVRNLFRDIEVARNTPDSSWGLIVQSGMMDNMVAQGLRGLANLASGDYESDMIFDEGMAKAKANAGVMTNVLAGVAPFVADSALGAFKIPGLVGKAVSTGTAKLATWSLNRVFGLGEEVAMRRLGGSWVYRIVSGGLSSSANFGTYMGMSAAVSGFRQGNFSWGETLHGAGHGAFDGLIFGGTNGTMSKIIESAKGGWAIAAETGALVTEAGVFTALDYMRTGEITAESVGQSLGMVLASRAMNFKGWTSDVAARVNGTKWQHQVKGPVRWSQETRDELQDRYPTLCRLMGGDNLAKDLVQGSTGKANRKTGNLKEVDAVQTANAIEHEWEQMQNDPTVDFAAKRMANYVLNGQIVPTPAVCNWRVGEVDDNGVSYGETLDINGNVIERFKLTNDKERRDFEQGVAHDAERNRLGIEETIWRSREVDPVIANAIDAVASANGIDPNELAKAYFSKDSEIKGKAMRSAVKDAESLVMDEMRTKTNHRVAVEDKYDIDLEEVIKTPARDRTENEQRALDEYEMRLTDRYDESQDKSTAELISEDMEQSRNDGFEAQGDERADIKERLEDAANVLLEMRIDPRQFDRMSEEEAAEWLAQHGNDEEAADAVMEYMTAKAAFEGIRDRVQEESGKRIEESNKQTDERTNSDTGGIHPVKMKEGGEEGRDAFVIKGKIVVNQDGTIDTARSDKDITVFYPDTGEKKVMTIADVKSGEPTIDPEQAKQDTAQQITEEVAGQAADDMNRTLKFNQDDTFNVLVDGKEVELKVVGVDPESGNPILEDHQGRRAPAIPEMVQQMHDEWREWKRNGGEPAAEDGEVGAENDAAPRVEETPAEEQGSAVMPNTDGDPQEMLDYFRASGMSDKVADKTITNNIVAAAERLEEAQRELEESKETDPQKLADLDRAVQNAQRELDYWNEVGRRKWGNEAPAAQQPVKTEEPQQSNGMENQPAEEPRPAAETGGEEYDGLGMSPELRERMDDGTGVVGLVDEIAKQLGLQVREFDGPSYMPGYIEDGVIWINRNREEGTRDTYRFTLGHELTHGLKEEALRLGRPDLYESLKNAALRTVQLREGSGYDAFVRNLTNRYQKAHYMDGYNKAIAAGKSEAEAVKAGQEQAARVTREFIEEEIVCDTIGELMSGDVEGAQRMMQQVEDKTLVQKFKDYIVNLLTKIRDSFARGSKEYNELDDTIAKWNEMYNEVMKEREEMQRGLESTIEDDAGNAIGKRASVSSTFEGMGFKFFDEELGEDGKRQAMEDEEGNLYVTLNGRKFDKDNHVTIEDVADVECPMNWMLRSGLDAGKITPLQQYRIQGNYVKLLNLFLDMGAAKNGGVSNLEDNYQMLGETVFRCISPNGDKQYTVSADITRICKKNEAVINTISELQRRQGYGATPAQILDIYMTTHNEGYQVPCPVCYVFSRYIRNGKFASSAINGMEMYGQHLPGGSDPWSVDRWVQELKKLGGLKDEGDDGGEKNEGSKMFKDMSKAANDAITRNLNLIDEQATKLANEMNKPNPDKARIRQLETDIRRLADEYKKATDVFNQMSQTNWIKTFAIRKTKAGWVMWEDAKLPEDMEEFKEHALDLRLTASTIENYPAIQRLRRSGGSASGKEITQASNNEIGEAIMGIGQKGVTKYNNYYKEAMEADDPVERDRLLKEAQKKFDNAVEFAAKQNLRGGQRMWSWSDNIERLSPDIVSNLMQLEILGSGLQSYSKQLEGVEMVARMNGYVNGSLMGKDDGYREVDESMFDKNTMRLTKDIVDVIYDTRLKEDRDQIVAGEGAMVHEVDGKYYVLIYDDVLGISAHGRKDADGNKVKMGLFDLNGRYNRAGNILVTMNDLHSKLALADDRVHFIIPWHSSGANSHVLAQMLNVLGQHIGTKSVDYTPMQEEKDMANAKNAIPQHLHEVWDKARAHAEEKGWTCGIGKIDSNRDVLTKSQIRYRELRDAIMDGTIEVGSKEYKAIMADEFLRQTYEAVQEAGGKMTSDDKKYIYPYEYWIKTETDADGNVVPARIENADENGWRYMEYCRRLGRRPKFSGKYDGEKWSAAGDFTESKGYWKTLIDRRMYDLDGNFQDMTPIDSSGFDTDLVDRKATAEKYDVTTVADDEGVNRIVDIVQDTERTRIGEYLPNYGQGQNKAAKAMKPSVVTGKEKKEMQKRMSLSGEEQVRFSLVKVDGDYKKAVEKKDETTARKYVEDAANAAGMATDESGKLIDLYHGTDKFGFTIFDRLKSRMGAFFTSTRRNVAANYAGDDHYAGVRKINKGYKQDDSQEGILNNARSVFDQDWKMATEEQKGAIVTKVEADARKIADEIDKRKDDANALPADDELDIVNAAAWVEDLFYTVAYARENGNEGEDLYRLVSNGVDMYNKNKQVIRDYISKHYDELDDKTKDYLNYLTSYDSGDVAIDISSSYKNILSGKDLATATGDSLITLDKLKEITDETHNIGSYHLYGHLGDNPLIVDAEGKNWYSLEYEGRKFDTDTLAQYAKENGYTALVVKNVYDYGDKADDYIFFEPSQLKSADPATYDDNGKLIPLSRRFDLSKGDVRFSLSDEDYSQAVENGDQKKVTKMVKDAVKAAMPNTKAVDRWGKPRLLYHGTPQENQFYEFNGTIYLSSNRSVAGEYTHYRRTFGANPRQTGRIMPVFVNLENPLEIDANRHLWRNIDVDWSDTPVTTRDIEEYAKENGYDGVIIKRVRDNMYDNDPTAADVYIAFSPEQVKSAGPTYEQKKRSHFPWDDYSELAGEVGATYDNDGNLIPLSERFNLGKKDIRFSLTPTFYSNAARAVEGVKQEKAKAEQWKAMLTKAGGIKAGEDKWMGLSTWLDEHKGETLTKDEVRQFVAENGIRMEEVNYGDKTSEIKKGLDDFANEFDSIVAQKKEEGSENDVYDEAFADMVEKYGEDFDMAFMVSKTNFPESSAILVPVREYGGELSDAAKYFLGVDNQEDNLINKTRLDYTTPGLENKREIAFVVPNVEPYQEHDEIHFGPENQGRAVMWVRFGETRDADGKRVLVIDEIQSNRHQDAREKGYKGDRKEFDAFVQQMADKYFDGRKPGLLYNLLKRVGTQEEVDRYKELSTEANRAGIPAAPFEKNWHEVAMKRMLRLAAEEGYDKVAWTTGEQQAERYGLGGIIDSIYIAKSRRDNSKYAITVFDKNADVINSVSKDYTPQELADTFGKDMAQRLIDGEAEKSSGNERYLQYHIEGVDLEVGREGMKGFYDRMLPQFMNKYGKRWGVKVGEVTLDTPGGETMHSVDVNEDMKRSVMQGQPLFSLSLGAPYQGSKGQIATSVVDRLPKGKRFVDLFSGGGAMTHAAMLSGKYEEYRMNDINPAGQDLFLGGMRGDYRDYIPREMTDEEFKAIKGTPEGLMLSYGGLGRNIDNDAQTRGRRIRRVQRLEALKPYADKVEASNTDYRDVQLRPGDVVYADIPYEGTNKTGYREGAKFDKAAFSEWGLAQDVPVFVSEQSMPEGWAEVASWNMRAMRGKQRDEKLFVQEKFADQVRDEIAQYPNNTDGPKFQLTEDIENYQPRDVSWERAMLDRLMETAGRNEASKEQRKQAVRSVNYTLRRLFDRLSQQPLQSNDTDNLGFDISRSTQAASRAQRKYDRWTVDDLVSMAKSMLKSGMYNDLRPYEVQRLINKINQGAGRREIQEQANTVFDVLMKANLRGWTEQLRKLMRTKPFNINQQGVRTIGQVDGLGGRILTAMRRGVEMTSKELSQRIEEVSNRLDNDDTAANELEGLMLAQQYNDMIGKYDADNKNIKDQIREQQEKIYDFYEVPVLDEEGNPKYHQRTGEQLFETRKRLKPEFGGKDADGNRTAPTEENKALRKRVEATVANLENSMRENWVRMSEGYDRITDDLGGNIAAAVTRAKEFRENEKLRKQKIYHAANSDLLDVDSNTETVDPSQQASPANWSLVRGLLGPLATFDKMLRFFGRRSANGEGRLFNMFMRRQIDCGDNEWRSKKAGMDEMDAKAEELFGKKWMTMGNEMRDGDKFPPITLHYYDKTGQPRDIDLRQDEAVYIYCVNKMRDGQMKLQAMGIDDAMVEQIKARLDTRLVKLADWYQGEFLPKQRNRYNEVYERMFGTPMAHIDNYIHLNINKKETASNQEIGEHVGDQRGPTNVTGSIKERTTNVTPIELRTSIFDLAWNEHDKMEHWAAWGEFGRDLKDLINYRNFRAKVLNMKSVEFGNGKDLLDAFSRCAAIVTGDYDNPGRHAKIDRAATNLAKGVTSAKIGFRAFTALKQTLSFPAFFSDARPGDLIFAMSNAEGSIKWAMENLPGFSKRWQSRQAGDTRLMETDSDWKVWRNSAVKSIGRVSMLPNAAVDCLTVAIGARGVYLTAKRRYLSYGYSEAQAEKKALQDAAISYNEAQQSSEGAFTSAQQVDRTLAGVATTVFRNASMGYERRFTQGIRNLKNMAKSGYREEVIENTKKQMMEDGLSEEQAQRAAERVYNRMKWHSMLDVVNFGFVLPFFWNLGPAMVYILTGNDDEEKKSLIRDSALHALYGPIEGLSMGGTMSELANIITGSMLMDGKTFKETMNGLKYRNFNPLPIVSDMQSLFNSFSTDTWSGMNDLFNLVVQMGVGFNPETFTDMAMAFIDASNGDFGIAKESAMGFLRLINAPKSQVDKLYMDELGLTQEEAAKMSWEDLAKRYAKYNAAKDAPLAAAFLPDDIEEAREERYIKKFYDRVAEKLEKAGNEDLERVYDQGDEQKKMVGKELAKRAGLEDGERFSKKSTSKVESTVKGHEAYQRKRTYADMAEDILLQQAKAEAAADGDEEREKKIKGVLDDIAKKCHGDPEKGIKGMGVDKKTDERILKEIRETRSKALKELKISR